ncbi:MaoC family dehydratase [Nocardiopsis potens]|uniref:MaoC family dehydratase n=1 Tax=Nocardiopsis potens TaxID=1246458 RepID=UPI00034B1AD1|nr:MaoC family dehydratase [Nocardiopsis potens]
MAQQAGADARSAEFTVPSAERYLEDYPVGARDEFGGAAVEEAEVLEFGRRFDPQPFHTDPGAAAGGPFGGLIASGWHTASLMMRMYAEHYLSPASSLGGPGVDELRWTAPVRPGDVLRVRVEVLENRRSRSKPDRGLLRTGVEVVNQDGTAVLRMTVLNLVRCRTAPGS